MIFSLLKSNGAQFSNQALNRPTNGRLDRMRLEMDHKLARRRFESLRKVRPVPLDECFPGLSKTRAVIQDAVATPFSLANADPGELIILSTLCAYRKPKLLLEFGTFDGLTALHMAINSDPQAKVITLDLHPDDPIRKLDTDDTFYSHGMQVGSQFAGTPEAARIEQVYCDSTKYDETPLAGQVEFIFVDAGHVYDLVKSDSEKSLKLLKPGGLILWHDYHYAHDGVYTYLNELAGRIPLFQIPGTKFVCYDSGKK
jgi:predicted O-methyltransferase YrrM